MSSKSTKDKDPRCMYYVSRMYELLRKHDLSLYALSIRSDVPCSTIKNSLNETKNPTYLTLQKICRGFGITIIEFFDTDEYRLIEQKVVDEEGIPEEVSENEKE